MLITGFSIVIPAYNCGNVIGKAITSVISQTYDAWELIIVNDGSTDDTVDVCEMFAKEDNRIKIINQVNQGPAKARFNGWRYASKDYVTFLDSDDSLNPNILENAYNIIQKDNDIHLIITKYSSESLKNTNYKCQYLSQRQLLENFFSHELFDWMLHGKIYKRCYIDESCFPNDDMKIGEDAFFNWVYFNRIENIYLSNYCGYEYVERIDSLSHQRKLKKDIIDSYGRFFKIFKNIVYDLKRDCFLYSSAKKILLEMETNFLKQIIVDKDNKEISKKYFLFIKHMLNKKDIVKSKTSIAMRMQWSMFWLPYSMFAFLCRIYYLFKG